MDRRGFVKLTLIGVGTAIFGGAIYQIIRELTGEEEKQQDRFVTVGAVERFAPDTVTEYPDDKFFLIRREDSGFLALHSECTHQSCIVPWVARDRQFQCPCHGSVFAEDGEVVHPPAPRPLDVHKITLDYGQVVVNAGRRIRREKADDQYVVYAP